MTIHINSLNFMIGLLLENKTAAEAAKKITELKKRLKKSGFSFGNIFPLILTDNGGEFSNVSAFENDPEGQPETHMFFCNPNAPYEKPHIEKTTLFSEILYREAYLLMILLKIPSTLSFHISMLLNEKISTVKVHMICSFLLFRKNLQKYLEYLILHPKT